MRDLLGQESVEVEVFVVKGEGHLFEQGLFWEDEGLGMGVVRRAVGRLDEVVEIVR